MALLLPLFLPHFQEYLDKTFSLFTTDFHGLFQTGQTYLIGLDFGFLGE